MLSICESALYLSFSSNQREVNNKMEPSSSQYFILGEYGIIDISWNEMFKLVHSQTMEQVVQTGCAVSVLEGFWGTDWECSGLHPVSDPALSKWLD